MSPVEMAHMQNFCCRNWDWVPFPTPGGLLIYSYYGINFQFKYEKFIAILITETIFILKKT
jgi:hypothetical protein